MLKLVNRVEIGGIGLSKQNSIRLTETVRCAGCASKIGPGALKDALNDIPVFSDPRVIRGMESLDNAGVFKLSEDLAIIQTVDFFPPLVDDPFTFGQIAVANALSDVYTMGGTPITAMNLVCFPVETMDTSVLRDVLRGGADKLIEAGAVLVGGHSIDDPVLKFGVSATGTVHPRQLVTNSGAKPGDKVILTKAIGSGIVITAMKAGQVDDQTLATVIKSMITLNKTASALMVEAEVRCATDITGFGFLGHTVQLANNSKVGIKINAVSVPLFPRVLEFTAKGLCPGGLYRNRDFYASSVKAGADISADLLDVFHDPQTSGGLLICIDPRKADKLLEKLNGSGVTEAAIIGEVVNEPVGIISIG
jgi:selenide,water dikinase